MRVFEFEKEWFVFSNDGITCHGVYKSKEAAEKKAKEVDSKFKFTIDPLDDRQKPKEEEKK
jgi:hypothetical protein